jgi:hypothetical protein
LSIRKKISLNYFYLNLEIVAPDLNSVEKAERYLQSVQIPVVINKYSFEKENIIF